MRAIRRWTCALVCVLAVASIPAAGAAPSRGGKRDGRVSALTARRGIARGIRVISIAGTAAAQDRPWVVAVDDREDVMAGGIGVDLVRATVRRPNVTRDLLEFKLEVDDPVPTGGTTFGDVIVYYWAFRSPGGGGVLMAMQSNHLTEGTSHDPVFIWLRCACAVVGNSYSSGYATGKIGGRSVTWRVSMRDLGVGEGVKLTPVEIGVQAGMTYYSHADSPGSPPDYAQLHTPLARYYLREFFFWTGEPLVDKTIDDTTEAAVDLAWLDRFDRGRAYTIQALSVRAGIAPPSVPVQRVPLRYGARVRPNGRFSFTIPERRPGPRRAVVQVCYAGRCGPRVSTEVLG